MPSKFKSAIAAALKGTGYEANGQVIAAIGALLDKVIAAMPTLLPEIQALIALFGSQPTQAKGKGYKANGQVIAAIGALLSKLVAAMPTLLPEIQALIALFATTTPAAA
jgi:hypothetical protein